MKPLLNLTKTSPTNAYGSPAKPSQSLFKTQNVDLNWRSRSCSTSGLFGVQGFGGVEFGTFGFRALGLNVYFGLEGCKHVSKIRRAS